VGVPPPRPHPHTGYPTNGTPPPVVVKNAGGGGGVFPRGKMPKRFRVFSPNKSPIPTPLVVEKALKGTKGGENCGQNRNSMRTNNRTPSWIFWGPVNPPNIYRPSLKTPHPPKRLPPPKKYLEESDASTKNWWEKEKPKPAATSEKKNQRHTRKPNNPTTPPQKKTPPNPYKPFFFVVVFCGWCFCLGAAPVHTKLVNIGFFLGLDPKTQTPQKILGLLNRTQAKKTTPKREKTCYVVGQTPQVDENRWKKEHKNPRTQPGNLPRCHRWSGLPPPTKKKEH